MKIQYVIFFLVLLSCETSNQPKMTISEIDHSICTNEYGLKRGSAKYSDCRLTLAQLRLKERDQQLRRSKILMEYGAYISRCGLAGELCR